MKCEICHKADATRAIRRGDSEDDELYVCAACAKAERQSRQKKSQRTRKVTGLPPGMSMSVTQISPSGEDMEPPPIIGAIMNAFQDMVSDIEKAEKEAKKQEPPKMSDLSLDGTDGVFIVRGRLHLEGLHLIGELEAAKRALHAIGMELAGVNADGISDAGHVYAVQYAPDDEKKARRILSALLREERNARVRLFEEMSRVFGDALCRALSILKNCRLLSPAEQFDLLSPLRLAAIEEMLDGMDLSAIEKMTSEIDLSGGDEKLSQEERDKADAERADDMNRTFEDVVLNERAEEKFL